jgi:hypothetical protein
MMHAEPLSDLGALTITPEGPLEKSDSVSLVCKTASNFFQIQREICQPINPPYTLETTI